MQPVKITVLRYLIALVVQAAKPVASRDRQAADGDYVQYPLSEPREAGARWSELSSLQPRARAPMREAPGGLDRRKPLHVAVDVPDPAGGPERAAGNR
jgi:hypothetical protein